MQLDNALISGLNSILPLRGRYRVCIRGLEGLHAKRETDDPLTYLYQLPSDPDFLEFRVEQVDEYNNFRTLAPYARLQSRLSGDIEMDGPLDVRGFPVRLMIYDESSAAYVYDEAAFGSKFKIHSATLPMGNVLRYRYYFWFPTENEWREQGDQRLLPGSGKLGAPTAVARDDRFQKVYLRLVRSLPEGCRDSGGLVEFFDDVDCLADAPVHLDADNELRNRLAAVLASTPISELRYRTNLRRPDGSAFLGQLTSVASPEMICESLLRLATGARDALPDAELALLYTHADDTPRLASYVASFLFKAIPEGVCATPKQFDLTLFNQLREKWQQLDSGSVMIGETLNYLALYEIVRLETVDGGYVYNDFFESNHLVTIAPIVLEATLRLTRRCPEFFSTLMFTGKIESIRSRERAAELFRRAMNNRNFGTQFAPFDSGAATYFDGAEIIRDREFLESRRLGALQKLINLSTPRTSGDQPVFLFSCDIKFLAIYYPYWIQVVDYCKSIGMEFHFLLIGTQAITARALDLVAELGQAIANLRSSNPETFAENVSFSTWEVPDWCPTATSFYACARYLAVGELTKRFDRDLLVQDIDFILVRDPKPFLDEFPKAGIGIQPSEGLYGLDPWRRFMGGTFYVPNDERVRETLRHMEAYLVKGLAVEESWYLDQNALAYLFEVASREQGFADFWRLKMVRPTMQFHINKLYEAAQGDLDY